MTIPIVADARSAAAREAVTCCGGLLHRVTLPGKRLSAGMNAKGGLDFFVYFYSLLHNYV